jgi:hypothetical protein
MKALSSILVAPLLCATVACSSSSGSDIASTGPHAGSAGAAGMAGAATSVGGAGGSSAGAPGGGAAGTAGTGNAGVAGAAGSAGSATGGAGSGGSAGGNAACGPAAPSDVHDPAPTTTGPLTDSTPFCSDGVASTPCTGDAAAWRQDGSFAGSLGAYEADALTVKDLVTGLTWQRGWACAPTAFDCTQLALGGFTDWHVPNVIELVSLIDYGAASTLRQDVFPSSPAGPYLSSDQVGGDFMNLKSVTVSLDGKIGPGAYKNPVGTTRCVRSVAPAPDWKATTDGQAESAAYRLVRLPMTTAPDVPQMATWTQALKACASLDHGGSTAWRLPSMKEATLLLRKQGAGSVDLLTRWTSTPDRTDPTQAWLIKGATGALGSMSVEVKPAPVGQSQGFECVRDATP